MVTKKKIVLVNPKCLDDRISDEDARVMPMGVYYIGALLMENGYETGIINLAAVEDDPSEFFKEQIIRLQPDIIGFSVTNPNRWNAVACAKAAKKIDPGLTIVFGGPAPTFLSEHLLSVCPEIDFIVAGEGELTFLELAARIGHAGKGGFEKIPGLVFRERGRLVKTPPQRLVKDLDDLVPPSKYFAFQHLSMSRGCPGNCTFCGSPEFWKDRRLRFHSPEYVANEIEALTKKGISHFYISDDTFTVDKPRVIEFCKKIIQKNLPITWNAISRVDAIDDDLLFFMRKAGCIQISFGVESGCEKIRKKLGKPIAAKNITRAFSLTVSYGILPRAYFIYGSPGETEKSIQKSIDLINLTNPLSAVFYMLVIFPGTRLYQKAIQDGLISDDIWKEKIEDIPWFEVDEQLDLTRVMDFGKRLRSSFFRNLDMAAQNIVLADIKELAPFHADFLSRLAMTFSHGEYAADKRVKNQDKTARLLYDRSLSYAPDARAFLGLAMLFQKQKNFHDAVNMLEKGLADFPENPGLLTCMGVSLMNMSRFKEALTFFNRSEKTPDTDRYVAICRQKTTEQHANRN